jgi:hypothetical protein
MAVGIGRLLSHNQNTHNTPTSAVVREYGVPTVWTPPRNKGIRVGGTNTIISIEAPTPITGSGDPRVMGTRTVNTLNTATVTG